MEPDEKPSANLHNGNGHYHDGGEMKPPANVIINDDGVMIGEAYESSHAGDLCVDLPAEANARLWAAAPDLLSALKEFFTTATERHPDLFGATVNVRAAIAKAKVDV